MKKIFFPAIPLFLLITVKVHAISVPVYFGDEAYPVKQNIFVLDNNDSGGDIEIRFGSTLAEFLKGDADGGDSGGWFDLSHALRIYEDNTNTGVGTGLTIENDGSGDSLIQFLLTGLQRWVIGIDNSDSDKLKISSSIDLDTDNIITIDTAAISA